MIRMVPTLVRRHKVVRDLSRTVPFSLVTSALALNVLGFMVAVGRRNGDDGALALFVPVAAATVVLSLSGLLFKSDPTARCRAWEASLPLTGRQIWLAHWLALTLAAVVQVVVAAVVVCGMAGLLMTKLDVQILSRGDLAYIILWPLGLAVAGAAAVAAARPDLARTAPAGGGRRRGWIMLAAMVAAVAADRYLHVLMPLAVGLALLAARRAYVRVGPTLEWLDSTDANDTETYVGDPAWSAAPSAGTAWLTISRQLSKWPASWLLGLPLTACFGLVLGGWFPSGDGEPTLRWSNVAISAYILFAFSGHFMDNLYRVDHLPISRRSLLGWLLLPGMAALTIGYGGAQLMGRADTPETVVAEGGVGEHIRFDNDTENYGLKVPPEIFTVHFGRRAPVIEAPWGETGEPVSTPVVRGLPLRLWKPYTTPLGSTRQFVAWQISRAVRALYGADLDPAVLADRYLTTAPDGRVLVRADGLTLVADHPELRVLPGGPVFAVLGGGVMLLTLVVYSLHFRIYRPGVTKRRARIVFWSLMGAMLLAHLGNFGLLIGGLTEGWIVSGAVFGSLRRLGGIGDPGWVVAWGVVLALVAIAWRLTERVFQSVEAPRWGSRD